MNRRSLSPLPPLCIVLSQWQGILQPGGSKKEERRAMSRYGMGLIVVTVLIVAAAAAHSGLSSNMTMDSAKSALPEFSDEERGRIFDGIMRISDAPIAEMVAPEVADPLPEEVPMQELPNDIIREI